MSNNQLPATALKRRRLEIAYFEEILKICDANNLEIVGLTFTNDGHDGRPQGENCGMFPGFMPSQHTAAGRVTPQEAADFIKSVMLRYASAPDDAITAGDKLVDLNKNLHPEN